jgi:hypothetical protein
MAGRSQRLIPVRIDGHTDGRVTERDIVMVLATLGSNNESATRLRLALRQESPRLALTSIQARALHALLLGDRTQSDGVRRLAQLLRLALPQ